MPVKPSSSTDEPTPLRSRLTLGTTDGRNQPFGHCLYGSIDASSTKGGDPTDASRCRKLARRRLQPPDLRRPMPPVLRQRVVPVVQQHGSCNRVFHMLIPAISALVE